MLVSRDVVAIAAACALATAAATSARASMIVGRDSSGIRAAERLRVDHAGAAGGPTLIAYAAARRVAPGALVSGGASRLVLVAPRGGFADGQIAVRRGGGSARWAPGSAPELAARTDFFLVAQTRVRGRLVPDPLPRLVSSVAPPAVIFVRISTTGLAARVYAGRIAVGAESIPVTLTVSAYALPPRSEGFRTLFEIQPQTYYRAVDGRGSLETAEAAGEPLFELLSEYRISPGNWGYGMPNPRGYAGRSEVTMRALARFGFNTLRLPLSNQRQVGRFVGDVSPRDPSSWSPWLARVRPFWLANGYADRAVAWTLDEPGPNMMALLSHQARVVHEAFPEAKILSTMTPGKSTRRLRDGGSDDLDIWVILSRRFYGTFRAPRRHYRLVREIARRGKELWSFTYHGVAGSPGYDATEPLTNARVFFVWNALEGIKGTLYGDGLARYRGHDPWRTLPDHGQSVFIYPGSVVDPTPVSSLRLEALRDGIQDANIFTAYAKRFGRGALVRLVAKAGLFKARDNRLLLACTSRCELRSSTKYAFPAWQRNERRAAEGLDRARLAALTALGRG